MSFISSNNNFSNPSDPNNDLSVSSELEAETLEQQVQEMDVEDLAKEGLMNSWIQNETDLADYQKQLDKDKDVKAITPATSPVSPNPTKQNRHLRRIDNKV